MISYKIISRHSSKKDKAEAVSRAIVPTDKDFKDRLFGRLLHRFAFKKGTLVTIIHGKEPGIVTKVEYDPHQAQWENNKPYFIEVQRDRDGRAFLCHPSQLKLRRPGVKPPPLKNV